MLSDTTFDFILVQLIHSSRLWTVLKLVDRK